MAGSSRLDEIGVIMHGIDGFEDSARPWAACSPVDAHCSFLSDRLSTSVVYRGKASSFSTHSRIASYEKVGSYILDPFKSTALCAFGGDGGAALNSMRALLHVTCTHS